MTDNEVIALLRMQNIPGLGPVKAKKLIALAGTPAAVFDDPSLPARVKMRTGLEMALRDESHLKAAEREYAYTQREGIRCVPYLSPEYPKGLAQCDDGPVLFFAKGRISWDHQHILAVVGTREMTRYGRRFCERFIEGISFTNPLIVSGLAYGVDVCAQEAALAHGLQTVACMAHGLDAVYPEAHSRLAPQIMEHGGFISEFWSGTAPEPHNFLRRNRIIAGLGEATVVVESAARGGSLVTADLAFGYNREVFAVPGRVDDTFSEGCNGLIRQQKAQLLTSAEQFLEAMNWPTPQAPLKKELMPIPGHWSELEKRLAACLREREQPTLDDLARECQEAVQKVAAALFDLELQGFVRPLPGKRYDWSG